MSPTISIVVPLYNLASVVSRALVSIRDQEFQDWECIVVDDGSTDGGGSVADSFAAIDERIRVVHQANAGLSNALNTGFSQARGDEFMILSADDALARAYMLHAHRQLNVKRADIISTDMMAGINLVKCIAGNIDHLREGNCHHYAALYKRWLFERTGGYKPTMNPSWEDYEFWVSCAEAGAKWTHLGEPLFLYYPNNHGRSIEADGKERLLRGKMHGYHPVTFGKGRGLVSVIIPCYKHEQFLAEAVDSVNEQTYPHVQAIVVNDASPMWSEKHVAGHKCIVLTHRENRGLSAARNTGLHWAISELDTEYWIALDADDRLQPEFIEQTMGAMKEQHWVYTDVRFIGDAWHELKMAPWECMKIGRKHQNPCTFLAETRMYQDVRRHRGYGYDESEHMRVGYEDMEFGLACVERGWNGQYLPGCLFNYRFHKEGSMRTRANEVRERLVRYIASRHPWAYSAEGLQMACKTCGGAKRMATTKNAVDTAKLGAVPLGEPLKVTFNAAGTAKQTKVGVTGRVYRYSAKSRTFIIDPRDEFLFRSGQFTIERVSRFTPVPMEAVVPAPPPPVVPTPVKTEPKDIMAAALEALQPDLGEQAEPVLDIVEEPKKIGGPRGRLLVLPHLTSEHVNKLWRAAIRSVKAVSEMSAERLESLTGLSRKEAQEVITHARAVHKSA